MKRTVLLTLTAAMPLAAFAASGSPDASFYKAARGVGSQRSTSATSLSSAAPILR